MIRTVPESRIPAIALAVGVTEAHDGLCMCEPCMRVETAPCVREGCRECGFVGCTACSGRENAAVRS